MATLKGLENTARPDGLHRRYEYETVIPPCRGVIDRFSDDDFQREVEGVTGGEPLEPLFSLSQMRLVRSVSVGDLAIGEMSLDEVTLRGEEGETLWREVEVELTGEQILPEAARLDVLLRGQGLVPETRSKFHTAIHS